MKKIYPLFFLLYLFLLQHSTAQTTTIVATGTAWKYSTGTDLGTGWKATGYNDAAWSSGNAELGYGDADEATVIPSGPAGNYYPTYYFRKTFSVADASLYVGYTLTLKRDDGVVVYLNGTEIFRDNMPAGTPAYTTWASVACADDGTTWFTAAVSSSLMVTGNNVLAVEVHQSSVASSDVSFNLGLTGSGGATLTRGPYLQLSTPTSMILRWRTDVATNSIVNYGLTSGSLNLNTTDNTSTTEHIVQLSGLTANTKYYYSVGNTAGILQGDTNNFFVTAPVTGTEKTIRVWATGDCGTALSTQTNVRNAYESFAGNNYTDLWVLLGDNAYNGGYDNEYQSGFFQPYMAGKVMRQTVLFPAPGNHDYDNSAAQQPLRTGAYYQNFTLPTAAEAGGVASGTEAYYSYNYGNIHFISLDSYGTESGSRFYDTTKPQIVWLKQDLAANTQKWTIVYWHHPPYTKGSHNSDTESDLVDTRNYVVRILDRYKVDLVMCGHSHLYERSRMMKGHYGLETTFDSTLHTPSLSNAKYDGTTNSCPYVKSTTAAANEGIVYVVSGSAGKFGGTTAGYPHNAMIYSNVSVGGSFYLEINGNRLDAKWITETGTIADKFTIMKDVNKKLDTIINSGQAVTLNASWNGVYQWTPAGATTQSISPAPVAATTYYATDGSYNCIHDTFNVKIKIDITGTVANTICSGTSNGAVDISVAGGTQPYTYLWSNGAVTQDIGSLSAGNYTVTVADFYLNSATVMFTVGTTIAGPVIGPPIEFTGPGIVCRDDTATYSISPVTNATSYTWAVPANTTLLSGQGTVSIRVLIGGGFTSGNISVYPSYCTVNGATKTFGVSRISAPIIPPTISGSVIVCPADIKVYSITNVTDASSYTWAAPANATIISGQGTTSATIQFNAGFTTGNVSVYASNCSGNSPVRTLNVTTALSFPGIIAGVTTNVCGGTSQNYSISPVAGATSYSWVVTGATITTGQGTTSVSVSFAPGYTSATIKVQAISSCANGSFSKPVTVMPSPAAPGTVSGTIAGICGGTASTYSITAVPGVTGYNWVVTNATIVSGQGTTSISVSFLPGYSSATIKVQSVGACMNSAFSPILTVRPIPLLTAIRGTFYGYCGGASGVKFYVSPIATAASYTWSVPAGITIVGGQGTDTVTVNIASGFISGSISVYATNSCGNGSAISSTVRAIPSAPLMISGSASVCTTAAVVYSIAAVVSATSYNWTVPAGWTIQSGQGTTILNVLTGSTGGNVRVAAVNSCGSSGYSQKTVAMAACKNEGEKMPEVESINTVTNNFNVFPNPASDYVMLSFAFSTGGEANLSLFDLEGKLVKHVFKGESESGVAYQTSLATADFPNGVYVVRASCNGAVLIRKLIIAN